MTTSANRYPAVLAILESMPQVQQCQDLTGKASFLIKVAVASVGNIETIIEQISSYGETQTPVVLSSPIKKQGITAPNSKIPK
ncbi:MAG: Lrp/AsnC ligand binding domain-containing protein [Anaerolineae bacterium]|nr:Lrp/AsnC ligand binding domain-containing protein [Anaerolineae bacterium]